MKTKICTNCKRRKKISSFPQSNSLKRGKPFLQIRSRCIPCHREYMTEYSKKYRKKHEQKLSARHKERNKEKRLQCLIAYGGKKPKCACCGESTIEFLTLDHIEGQGRKHREEVGHGTQLYYWLIANNFPPILQVLCHNCNAAKYYYKQCPHQQRKTKSSTTRSLL